MPGIQVTATFDPAHNLPLDERAEFATMADAISSDRKVEGLIVYIKDVKKHYQWDGQNYAVAQEESMPVAPTGHVSGANGSSWYELENVERRFVIANNEIVPFTEEDNVITIDAAEFAEKNVFILNYNGAVVTFYKEQSDIVALSAVSLEGKIYEFAMDWLTGIVTITEVESAGGGTVDTVDGVGITEDTKDIALTQYITKAEYAAMVADPGLAKAGVRYIVDGYDGAIGMMVPDYANVVQVSTITQAGNALLNWTADKDGYAKFYAAKAETGISGLEFSVNSVTVFSDDIGSESSGVGVNDTYVTPIKKGDIVGIRFTNPAVTAGIKTISYIPPILTLSDNITVKPVNQLLTMGPPNPASRIGGTSLTLTAPEDGYAEFTTSANGTGTINGATVTINHATQSQSWLFPVKKGDVITNVGTNVYFFYPVVQPPQYLEPYKIDYSTIEQDTGRRWINGKTIYQKTMQYTMPAPLTSGNSITLGTVAAIIPGASQIIKGELFQTNAASVSGCLYHLSGGNVSVINGTVISLTALNINVTLQYIK